AEGGTKGGLQSECHGARSPWRVPATAVNSAGDALHGSGLWGHRGAPPVPAPLVATPPRCRTRTPSGRDRRAERVRFQPDIGSAVVPGASIPGIHVGRDKLAARRRKRPCVSPFCTRLLGRLQRPAKSPIRPVR